MGINKSAYVLGTRRHGSHLELQRKFDCNLRVAIQNGIHAGPVAHAFCNFTISECQRHEVPMLIAAIGIGRGLGLGLGFGLDFGLGLGIVTGAPFRGTCHTLGLGLGLGFGLDLLDCLIEWLLA